MLPRSGGGLSRRKGDKGSHDGSGVMVRRCLTCFMLFTVLIVMSWTLYGISSSSSLRQHGVILPQPKIVGQPQPKNLLRLPILPQSHVHVPDKNEALVQQPHIPLDSPEEIRKAQDAEMDTNEPIPLLDEEQLDAMKKDKQPSKHEKEEEDEDGLEFEKAVADQRIQKAQEQQQQQQVLVLSFTSKNLPPGAALRITLRPDLSQASVEYIHEILKNGCERCKFYRAEKPGILQGIMANEHVALAKDRGPCPAGLEKSVVNECPAWDANCGCHGPLMERGMVGWAAGATGPDFFINDYRQRADFWGTQHTVFGRIVDDASFTLLDTIFEMPVHTAGLTMLDEELKFTMHIE